MPKLGSYLKEHMPNKMHIDHIETNKIFPLKSRLYYFRQEEILKNFEKWGYGWLGSTVFWRLFTY